MSTRVPRTIGLAMVIATSAATTAPELHAQASKTATAVTTKDFNWLIGQWEGTSNNHSGLLQVTFNKSAAGLISGVMQFTDSGKVLVVELLTLVDAPSGLELRFRHFSPTLELYEPTYKQQMRLRSHSTTRDEFANLVPYEKGLMSTQPRVTTFIRDGADRFTGHSDILGDDGKPAVIESRYHRVK